MKIRHVLCYGRHLFTYPSRLRRTSIPHLRDADGGQHSDFWRTLAVPFGLALALLLGVLAWPVLTVLGL